MENISTKAKDDIFVNVIFRVLEIIFYRNWKYYIVTENKR
jgi:hypothetical protein